MTLIGKDPLPWQEEVLRDRSRYLQLLCARQIGKTFVAASLALQTALLEDPATVLVISPSERQSGEFVQAVRNLYNGVNGRAKEVVRDHSLVNTTPIRKLLAESIAKDAAYYRLPARVRESALQLHLSNGSRIIGLPASEGTVRGYSAISLIVIDEAARVPDDLYRAVRPMLSASRGRMICLSTPFGKRGWFWEEWDKGRKWKKWKVVALMCPWHVEDPEFLPGEEYSLGARWFRQEYFCSFEDAIDQLIPQEDIEAAFLDWGVKPLFGGS
jgi:hypothetical protein